MGLLVVALVLSAIVVFYFWLLDRLDESAVSSTRIAPIYDPRWCVECRAIVQVDVWQSDAIADVVCVRCGNVIDVIDH